MALPSDLFVFGDQSVDLYTHIRKLTSLAHKYDVVKDFFLQVNDALTITISLLDPMERQGLLAFGSLLELAEQLRSAITASPAAMSALLCVTQIGELLICLMSYPRVESTGDTIILGQCTGGLAASLSACCDSLHDVARLGPRIVVLAFYVGLEATRRSKVLDTSDGSWAISVSNMKSKDAQEAIDCFCLAEGKAKTINRPYVSAETPSTVTISGPPSALKALQLSPVFNTLRIKTLPIYAAYHASHLGPVDTEDFVPHALGWHKWHVLPGHYMISPSTGVPYLATNLEDLLCCVIHDTLENSMSLEKIVASVASLASTGCLHISHFGPVLIMPELQTMLPNAELRKGEMEASSSCDDALARHGTGTIAVVGMALRLPGSENPDQFWESLMTGISFHKKIPRDRFDVDIHYDKSGRQRNTTLTSFGCFIDHPGWFDAKFFNVSPREAAQTDPQQRILLLAVHEALENAGYVRGRTPSSNPRRIGSFIGVTGDDYREVNAGQEVDIYHITGNNRAFGPGRLNYFFGWEGPSFCIDTACSSSFTSLQLACSTLLSGHCDTAVSGGVNVLTNSDLFAGLSRANFLSKTGPCKTLDNEADGYCRADGAGIVVLKRLEDALWDNDNILGVIEAITTNHSCEAVSITHPHAKTQERLFQHVLRTANVDPQDITYIELHGTGTQAGDAIEVESVTNVFAETLSRQNPLYIGSVKPNVGHSESASGVTSLIKSLLMLQKAIIPPHIGIQGHINRKLPPLDEMNVRVPLSKTPFPALLDDGVRRRILINNFDAAGGNTCLLLGDGPTQKTVKCKDPRSHHVVVISGKSAAAARSNCQHLLSYCQKNPDLSLHDIAYTTTARRTHYAFRKAFSSNDLRTLTSMLSNELDAQDNLNRVEKHSPIIFVFTGQGSQYPAMGRDFMKTSPIFRKYMLKYAEICDLYGFPSFLPLVEQMDQDIDTKSPIQIQLALVSLQLALAKFWRSLGVHPLAVLGHSLGEYSALCVAGVISESDCLYLVGQRAQILQENCIVGSHCMLVLKANATIAKKLLLDLDISTCQIACLNTPNTTVISGLEEEIATLESVCISQNVKTRRMNLPYAFHSSQMDPILAQYGKVTGGVSYQKPSIPVASTMTSAVVTDEGVLNGVYLQNQTRGLVNFTGALQSLRQSGLAVDHTLWLEVGPDPVCLSMIQSTLDHPQSKLLSSFQKSTPSWQTITKSLAALFDEGVDVNWQELHRPYEPNLSLIRLPTYAFEYQNFWIQYAGDWNLRKGGLSATEKQNRPALSSVSLELVIFEEIKDASGTVKFVSDLCRPVLHDVVRGHVLMGRDLLSLSVYADMALAAASYLFHRTGDGGQHTLDVRDLEVSHGLVVEKDAKRKEVYTLAERESGSSRLRIKFFTAAGNMEHVLARCIVELGNIDEWQHEWSRHSYLVKSRIAQLTGAGDNGQIHKLLKSMVYKLFSSLMDYADDFKCLQEVYLDSDNTEGFAKLEFQTLGTDGMFHYNPRWIDGICHLPGFILNGSEKRPQGSSFVAFGWKSLKITTILKAATVYQAHVRMQSTKSHNILTGDVYLLEGTDIVAAIECLTFRRVDRQALDIILSKSPDTANQPAAHSDPALWRRPCEADDLQSIGTVHQSSDPLQANLSDMREDCLPPTTDKFKGLLQIIANETGTDVSLLDDSVNFSDIGIDSLLAIAVADKVRQSMRVELPASVFVDNQAVGSLRATLQSIESNTNLPSPDNGQSTKGVQDSSTSALIAESVLLQSSATNCKKTLFLLPDGSGSASSYINLCPINVSVRIYAFNSPYLESSESTIASIERMTASYVEEIQKIQPHGPYCIGGWSLGGVCAFEVATQMVTRYGQEVRQLIIIDAPSYKHCQKIQDSGQAMSILQQLGIFDSINGHDKREISLPELYSPGKADIIKHFSHSIDLLKDYRPIPLSPHKCLGHVTFIWARKGVLEVLGIEESALDKPPTSLDWMLGPRTTNGPDGWDELVSGLSVKHRWVDACHFSMMRRPSVAELSRIIAEVLE